MYTCQLDDVPFLALIESVTNTRRNYPADGDFWSLAGSGSCQDGEVDWVTTDLDGDGRLDLVIPDGPNCDGEAIGETRWLLHTGCL